MAERVLVAGPARLHDYLAPYCEALEAVGAVPVRDWPTKDALRDEAALRAFLERFQGLLLPGGADVEPWRYGEAPIPELGKTDAELDEGQLALAGLAMRSDLPTLGICRGIQVMAVAAGVGLYQDLPAQQPSNVAHEVRTTRQTLAHEVEVAPGSRLASLCGAARFAVNSRHHQAIRADGRAEWVGPLRVVARAPDGIVEGIEGPDHRFLVAVQWHPENLVERHPEAAGLFRGFAAACGHAR